MLVKCLNCGLIWKYVSVAQFEGTAQLELICMLCPKCSSNAYRKLTDAERIELQIANPGWLWRRENEPD